MTANTHLTQDLIQKGVQDKTRFWLVWILFLSLLVRVIYVGMKMPLWWDSHVYVGMGKYIFSGGAIGIWESFRPLIHPLILGTSWWMGFDPFVVGKVLDVGFSLLGVYLVFLIGREVWDDTVGLVACALFSFTGLFIMFSGLVLTEPLAIVFILGSTLLFIRERYLLAGILLGLSFLTKFPFVIVGFAFMIGLIGREIFQDNDLIKKVRAGSSRNAQKWRLVMWNVRPASLQLMIGFVIMTLPYFIFNWFRYGGAFTPLKEGSAIVTTYTWLYGEGIGYYLSSFFLHNGVYFLLLIFWYLYFSRKLWKNYMITTLFSAFLLLFAYFEYVPRKEVRYMVLGLPFLALIVGWTIVVTYRYLCTLPKPFVKPKGFVFTVGVIVLFSIPHAVYFETPQNFDLILADLSSQYNISGLVLTSDPALLSTLQNRIITLNGILYAPQIYLENKDDVQLLFMNSCDLSCPPQDVQCEAAKEAFYDEIRIDNSLMHARVVNNCTYQIYIPTRIVSLYGEMNHE